MRKLDFQKKQAFFASVAFCRLKPLSNKESLVRMMTDYDRNCQKVKYFLSLSVNFLPRFLAETRMRVEKIPLTEMTESKMALPGKKNSNSIFFSPEPRRFNLNNRTMEKIFNEIRTEREKQEAKWGQQNHPILDPVLIDRTPERMCYEYEIPTESRARQLVEIHAGRGDLTYMHILMEEISEVASCGSNAKELRKELIQSASVLVAMIESLDRNGR